MQSTKKAKTPVAAIEYFVVDITTLSKSLVGESSPAMVALAFKNADELRTFHHIIKYKHLFNPYRDKNDSGMSNLNKEFQTDGLYLLIMSEHLLKLIVTIKKKWAPKGTFDKDDIEKTLILFKDTYDKTPKNIEKFKALPYVIKYLATEYNSLLEKLSQKLNPEPDIAIASITFDPNTIDSGVQATQITHAVIQHPAQKTSTEAPAKLIVTSLETTQIELPPSHLARNEDDKSEFETPRESVDKTLLQKRKPVGFSSDSPIKLGKEEVETPVDASSKRQKVFNTRSTRNTLFHPAQEQDPLMQIAIEHSLTAIDKTSNEPMETETASPVRAVNESLSTRKQKSTVQLDNQKVFAKKYFMNEKKDIRELEKISNYKNLTAKETTAPIYIQRVRILGKHAFGAFAAKDMPASQEPRILGFYRGKLVGSDAQDTGYLMQLHKGMKVTGFIDAAHEGTWTRFINHSIEQANVEYATVNGEVAIVTLRDVEIKEGDQLLFSYGEDYQFPYARIAINRNDNADDASEILANNKHHYHPTPVSLPDDLCQLFGVSPTDLFYLPNCLSIHSQNLQFNHDKKLQPEEAVLTLLKIENGSLAPLEAQVIMTPLMIAAYQGDYKACEILIAANSNCLNQQEHHRYTSAIFFACMSNSPNKVEVIKLLSMKSEAPNLFFKDKDGLTPLHYCVNRGEADTIKNLFASAKPRDYYDSETLAIRLKNLLKVDPKDNLLVLALHKNLETFSALVRGYQSISRSAFKDKLLTELIFNHIETIPQLQTVLKELNASDLTNKDHTLINNIMSTAKKLGCDNVIKVIEDKTVTLKLVAGNKLTSFSYEKQSKKATKFFSKPPAPTVTEQTIDIKKTDNLEP